MMKRSNKPSMFFSAEEQKRIVEAIATAEAKTSGEIRIHLERKADEDVQAQAKELFEKLGMTATRDRTGVLIFIALADRKIVILGDSGINEKVGEGFWDDVLQKVSENFKKENYLQGIESAVALVAEKLLQYFPVADGDVDELPNEISTGE